MTLADLVSVRVRSPSVHIRGEARPTAAGDEESKGVFITPQSLVTFPGATFAVALLNKGVNVAAPQLQDAKWPQFVLSVVIGAVVYLISVTDPAASKAPRDRLIGAFIGLLNSIYLFIATVGVAAVLRQP